MSQEFQLTKITYKRGEECATMVFRERNSVALFVEVEHVSIAKAQRFMLGKFYPLEQIHVDILS
jgi:hypothetical protein